MMSAQKGDVVTTYADVSEIEKLGYKATTPLELGIPKFVNWFLDYYSSDKQVLTVSLFSSAGKQIRVLESNKALKQVLKEEPLLPKKFLSIPWLLVENEILDSYPNLYKK